MKMMDCVEVAIEKAKYAQDGVHQGMQGWICMEECCDGYWLVNWENPDIATSDIKEEDLRQIPVMDAGVNERIKEQFAHADHPTKAAANGLDDISGNLI